GFSTSKDKFGARSVFVSDALSLNQIIDQFHKQASSNAKFDFVLVNLTKAVNAITFTELMRDREDFFSSLRSILHESRYCGLVLEWPSTHSFSVPWALATAGRKYLKLRDEKIALRDRFEGCYYCLFFQAENDMQVPEPWSLNETHIGHQHQPAAPT